MNICIIPARGGSKRIPRKNIRNFCGKPMIAWSIQTAMDSGCFSKILVSTDDDEVAEIANSFGAETPFIRPQHLSNDHAGTIPVIVHAINWLKNKNVNPETICCLYATAPFIKKRDLQEGHKLIKSINKNNFVFTAGKFQSPIERALQINKKNNLCEMLLPENFMKRSQDLKESYFDAGQFYWGTKEAWLTTRNIFENSKMLILPKSRVQDIDNKDDWEYAELMHKVLNQN